MQFRLRTLLIVVALAPVVIGAMVGILILATCVAEARDRARNRTCTNTLILLNGARNCPPETVTECP